jgi:hypothetical protein
MSEGGVEVDAVTAGRCLRKRICHSEVMSSRRKLVTLQLVMEGENSLNVILAQFMDIEQ